MSEWLTPPPGGFVAEDLDRLTGLPDHAQLIDGAIVLRSPQTSFHMLTVSLLTEGLRRAGRPEWRVRREMTITLGTHQRPEADVFVIRAPAEPEPDRLTYTPNEVTLAVEVVEQSTVALDRERKPQLYAEARIPHFWRVESFGGRTLIYVHRLTSRQASEYTLIDVQRDRVRVSVPFDINIDLTEIESL